MNEEHQVSIRQPTPASFEEMERAAKWASESKLFGTMTPPQAMCLFLLCQSEGVNYIEALRRYHIIDGKPSMRADYMSGRFTSSGGAIMWHVRTDDVCAATFFADKAQLNDEARKRARDRFDLIWSLDGEADSGAASKIIQSIGALSREGEETILRTYEDCEAKGLTISRKYEDGKLVERPKHNWKQSPRQMLTARVITEGVTVISPGLKAGVYTPDEVEDITSNQNTEENRFIEGAFLSGKAKDRVAIQKMIDQYIHDSLAAKGARKQELLGLAADLRDKLTAMDEADEIPGIRTVEAEVLPARVDGELPLKGESPRVKIPWQEYILQHVTPKRVRGQALGNLVSEEITVLHSKSKFALEEGADVDPQIKTEAEYIKEAHDYYYKLCHPQTQPA